MKKNIRSSDHSLLANSKGQSLKEHSLGVALYGRLLLRSLQFKPKIEEEINRYLILSALLHDIGKVSSGFQKYIEKNCNKERDKNIPEDAESLRPKNFTGPFHNEISWAYTADFIDFQDKKTRNAVRHSVYWHHPANYNEKRNKLHFENSQAVFGGMPKNKEPTDKLIENIHNFVCDLFASFSIYYNSNFLPSLKESDQSEIDETPHPRFFSHSCDDTCDDTADNSSDPGNAKKQLCLNLLLESDRTISSWTPDKLKAFLKEWESYSIKACPTAFPPVTEDKSSKSAEQRALAEKMANKALSVCGVDPAGGKTAVALYWRSCLNNAFPLTAVLPRQHQVTGLFHSLNDTETGDCQRIYGKNHKIKIEAVFNGKRQHQNYEANDESDLLTSDINILVFDRFLSPYYKRNQSSEFLKTLRSHLVLDEFHEFKNIPKMIPALKEILTIRSWLESGVKTLMLSGTPEPSLLKLLNIEKSAVFNRSELSCREDHKFKMSFREKAPEKKNQFSGDCLYSFLRVDSCQKFFAELYKNFRDKITLAHSYFSSDDKKRLIEGILQNHGKSSSEKSSKKSVIASKMLQSSYNISFKKAVLELSQPYMDCQTAGRVNRFENKTGAEIIFFIDEETESFFNEKQAGFKEIHKSWKDHLRSFIESRKGEFISIRQLMKCYDCFWDCKKNICNSLEILKKQQEKAVEELNQYIPKRFSVSSGKNASRSSLNSLFRGESRWLSAAVVNDQGEPQSQLSGEDLLSESRSWLAEKFKQAVREALKSDKKCKQANQINNEEVFEYKKYALNAVGFKAERPLLSSHFNKEIDKRLEKALYDEDKNKSCHQVYHTKFGLVKKSLLKNED